MMGSLVVIGLSLQHKGVSTMGLRIIKVQESIADASMVCAKCEGLDKLALVPGEPCLEITAQSDSGVIQVYFVALEHKDLHQIPDVGVY